jgi:hypothetical protein
MAGFCIFNDISARDVQALEFVGGFCLTRDMAQGNQLGPYLATSVLLNPQANCCPAAGPSASPCRSITDGPPPQTLSHGARGAGSD